ncbi:MAG: ABC transporter permease [Lachnospiraceae bacterium]|nr:ABC transporter permease [Lachnospiraceae bacterium]
MNGLKYQLKSIRRDKMCILTFLLPIIVGIAINFLSGASFQTMSETSFGVLENDLSDEAVLWLQKSGTLTQYENVDELQAAVNNPSTQVIGVLKSDDGIKTLLSGDELEVNRILGNALPEIYKNRMNELDFERTVIPVVHNTDGLKALLITITLVTAMFMGCTFNAMNIISEKEDGVAFINMVLPLDTKTYIIQKILLGFVGGTASTILTALICMRIKLCDVFPFLVLVSLSAYIAALIGLFVGHFSDGLMVGIVYIKIIMILFIAPPIFFYLVTSVGSIPYYFSFILPSSATFYGLMNLVRGQSQNLWVILFMLLIHTVIWSVVYGKIKKFK